MWRKFFLKQAPYYPKVKACIENFSVYPVKQKVLSPDPNDIRYCWEQVHRVRPMFRLTHNYLPENLQLEMLARYALLCALEESMFSVSDEDVLRAKISWFQREVLWLDPAQSQHPIVRLLTVTQAIQQNDNAMRQHFLTTLNRIDLTPPRNEEELKTLCANAGRSASLLELKWNSESAPERSAFTPAFEFMGLVQLLRESSKSRNPIFAWVPLSLLARHQINRQQCALQPESDKAVNLCKDICDEGLSWLNSDQIRSLAESSTKTAAGQARLNHWLMQLNMDWFQMKRLARLGFHQHRRVFTTIPPVNVWRNWRFARSLKWN